MFSGRSGVREMPIVDDGVLKARSSGVYGFLRQYFEQDLRGWVANVGRSHWDDAPFPRQRILDDLRAGRTVNVPAHSLPKWAPRGPVHMVGTVKVFPARSIVRPEDAITSSDEDWAALFIEEHGL